MGYSSHGTAIFRIDLLMQHSTSNSVQGIGGLSVSIESGTINIELAGVTG